MSTCARPSEADGSKVRGVGVALTIGLTPIAPLTTRAVGNGAGAGTSTTAAGAGAPRWAPDVTNAVAATISSRQHAIRMRASLDGTVQKTRSDAGRSVN